MPRLLKVYLQDDSNPSKTAYGTVLIEGYKKIADFYPYQNDLCRQGIRGFIFEKEQFHAGKKESKIG